MTYKVGFSGAGNAGRFHLHGSHEAGLEPYAVAEPNEVVRESFLKEASDLGYELEVYATLDEMLSAGGFDVLAVTTPSFLHYEQIKAGILAGFDVLGEKPMAIRLAQCDELVNLAAESDNIMGFISQRRYLPAMEEAFKVIKEGKLGLIHTIDASVPWFRAPNDCGEYHEQEPYFPLDGLENTAAWRGMWNGDGGGALINQAIHYVDLVQYIGGEVSKIWARVRNVNHQTLIEAEDEARVRLYFKGDGEVVSTNALGTIYASTHDVPWGRESVRYVGTEGSVIVSCDDITEWNVLGVEKPDLLAGTEAAGADPTRINPLGHRKQYQNYAAAKQGKSKLWIPAHEAIKPVEVVIASYWASRQRGIQVYSDLPRDFVQDSYVLWD